MNTWTGRAIKILLIPILWGAIGCAPAKTVWLSTPDTKMASNRHFEATLVPLKQGDEFYRVFRLEVKNLTGSDLSIDWNKTLYLHDGRKNGLFVYEGIVPGDVRDRNIAPDIIPPGDTFSRTVAPFNLLSKAPLRSTGVSEGIRGGMLPEGENGMQLVIMYEGKALVENLTVQLAEQEAP